MAFSSHFAASEQAVYGGQASSVFPVRVYPQLRHVVNIINYIKGLKIPIIMYANKNIAYTNSSNPTF